MQRIAGLVICDIEESSRTASDDVWEIRAMLYQLDQGTTCTFINILCRVSVGLVPGSQNFEARGNVGIEIKH